MFRLSRWMERAIFVNILMLVFFVVMDYWMWMRIPVGFEILSYYSGTMENLRVGASYSLFTRLISISGVRTYDGFQSFCEQSLTPNFPLLVFFVSIMVNLLMIGMVERDKLK